MKKAKYKDKKVYCEDCFSDVTQARKKFGSNKIRRFYKL